MPKAIDTQTTDHRLPLHSIVLREHRLLYHLKVESFSFDMLCFSLAVSHQIGSKIDYLKRLVKFVKFLPLFYIAILQNRPVDHKRMYLVKRKQSGSQRTENKHIRCS
jgi:hypothetical protein